MNLIIDFFERAGVPDLERINSDMHDLVRQAKSAAEVLLDRTGASALAVQNTFNMSLYCRAAMRPAHMPGSNSLPVMQGICQGEPGSPQGSTCRQYSEAWRRHQLVNPWAACDVSFSFVVWKSR